jgi:hypothetical protein
MAAGIALFASGFACFAWGWTNGYQAGKRVGGLAEQKRLRALAEFNGPCCVNSLAHLDERHR